MVGSTIARETDAGIYNHAGPEIGVASTKAFLSQLTVLAMLTVFLGRQRNLSLTAGQTIVTELARLPEMIQSILAHSEKIKAIADHWSQSQNFFFIGRKYCKPIASEGALKLKEISYIHAEAYSAGELKHGPIALITENFPSLVICPQDTLFEKTRSNIEEIRARGGEVIVLTTEGSEEKFSALTKDILVIPKTLEILTPILASIPLHLFAYYMALARNCDPDQPRNLAKSVTVE